MHKIKAQARRHAWYNDEPDAPNYNPFAKHGISHVSSRSSVGASNDLESGLPSFGRANSARGPGIVRGSSAYQTPGHTSLDQQRLPPLSSGSSPASPRRSLQHESGHSRPEDQIKQEAETKHTDSTGTSGTLTGEAAGARPSNTNGLSSAPTEALDDTAKPRRRKMGGLLGLGKHKKDTEKDNDNGDDLDQYDSQGKMKKPKPTFTAWSQCRNTIFNSPVNILLIFVPIGIVLSKILDPLVGNNAKIVFATNFIAIVPLAALLSYATEEVALRTGETIGGLLNASFGNATELIVSIIALFNDEILITQTSLIGSMLSNLLLVLGMCFFFGGLTRVRQKFNIMVAQTASSLLALSLAGVLIPTVFDLTTQNNLTETDNIAKISRGVSILLLIVYGCYLYFQLFTHAHIYNAPSEKQPKRHLQKGEAQKGIAQIGGMAGFMAPQAQDEYMPSEEEEEEEPKLHIWVALFTLAVATALIAVNSEFMVDAIQYLNKPGEPPTISKSFLGLILIPIVGNAAEHATAVTVACKDKMDLAIGVAVGSSMQIALLVLPLVVVIGWIAGKNDMTLDFDLFQITVLFISVLLVNYLIQDGESTWLEGIMIMLLYTAVALASWFYPTDCQLGSFCRVNANATGAGA